MLWHTMIRQHEAKPRSAVGDAGTLLRYSRRWTISLRADSSAPHPRRYDPARRAGMLYFSCGEIGQWIRH
jgi:hypothetical protein